MNAGQATEHIRSTVRKVFPPTFNIEFTGGQSGNRGVITHVRIDAWIGAGRLYYDQSELLRLLEADIVEAEGDEYALLSGTIHGMHYELRLFAEPQAVSKQ